MKRSYISNLLLLGVLLVLLVFFEKNQQQSAPTIISSTLTAQQVEHIYIERPDLPSIQLERQPSGNDWQLKDPIDTQASTARINLLLSLLDTPASRQLQSVSAEQLEAFGLTTSDLRLRFNDTIYTFGNIESLGGHRYLQQGETVFLFEDDLSPLLTASASSFIDNRLFTAEEKISALTLPQLDNETLQLQEVSVTLSRQGAEWTSSAPKYSEAALNRMAQAWQHAYAMQVAPSSIDTTATITPIAVTLADGTQHHLFAVTSEQGLKLFHPQKQLLYLFPSALIPTFFPPVIDTP